MSRLSANNQALRAPAAKTEEDWSREWKALQRQRAHLVDAAFWDRRAATFADGDAPAPYVREFLGKARIRPGESVFDMGCGTGALSVPLGAAGHKVIAADFSQGMLDALGQALRNQRVTSVSPLLLSWDDDWDARGVEEECADVALASRSLSTNDLAASLRKLERAARRRVCLTVATGPSPRCDERALQKAHLETTGYEKSDCFYVLNLLESRGIRAEVSYLESERLDTFASVAEACAKYDDMLRDFAFCLDASHLERACKDVHRWLANQLVENEQAGEPDGKGNAQKPLRLREPRVTTWAFIAWDKQPASSNLL